MSAIIGGAYRGVINTHLYNGIDKFSREYEFGYIYGGMFVVGYCRFIHEYVRQNKVDKILFLARDGYIIQKVYELMYPEEVSKCRYMYWSRLAAAKLAYDYYKYDYFRRFLYHKMDQGYSIERIFQSMEIDALVRKCEDSIGISGKDILTDGNVEFVEKFINSNWTDVQKCYENQNLATKKYVSDIIGKAKNAIAVDIGWAGSCAVILNRLINNEWNINCRITGVVAGTNSFYTDDTNGMEPMLADGSIVSYMYSQSHNRE